MFFSGRKHSQSALYKPGQGIQPGNSHQKPRTLKVHNVELFCASFTAAGCSKEGEEAKENQDCWVVSESPAGHGPTALLLGVFDGHGRNGSAVSAIAAEHLPQQLFNSCEYRAAHYHAALREAFLDAHDALVAEEHHDMDCSMSGCTAVTALVVHDKLVVANAGDSRCLLGKVEDDKQVAAYEMTNDHTACIVAEANRVLAAGGRIATFEFNGERVGPPRVFEKYVSRPGLVITRSLGDRIAKRLGVIATPEVVTHALSPCDRYLVLVSDGITEFMGSQDIIDRVHGWASAGMGPDDAARRLVLEARARWRSRSRDGVIDDCTATVVYLTCGAHSFMPHRRGVHDAHHGAQRPDFTVQSVLHTAYKRVQEGLTGLTGWAKRDARKQQHPVVSVI